MRRTFSEIMRCLILLGLSVGGSAIAGPIEKGSVVFLECTYQGETTAGSGVVVDTVGRVITAKHVVVDDDATCLGALGTQSDAAAMKNMDVRVLLDDDKDVALLQFVPNGNQEYIPVQYSGVEGLTEGDVLIGYGYHAQNRGEPDRAEGPLKSLDVLPGGKLEADMNTQSGMSGGPIMWGDHLIGIIAEEEFDALGLSTATRFLSVDEFPEDIRRRLDTQSTESLDRERILGEQLAMNDVCTQILREQISLRQDRFPAAAQIANPLIDSQPSGLLEEAEFWVTVTTGPARWVDCRTGNMLKAFYFPTGLMLRPERDVSIDGERRTIFLTEHGMRVFLDRSAIAPVTPNVGYVFATASGAFKVCKRGDVECDINSEYRISEHDEHYPFLSGYQTYLRSEKPGELNAAYLLLQEMHEYQSDPPAANDPLARHMDLDDPDSLPACKEHEARLYTVLMRYDANHAQKGSAYQNPVRFSLCTVHAGSAYSRHERIKIVTTTLADERFSQLWAVNTIREMPNNFREVTKVLFDIDRPLATIVKCSDNPAMFITPGRAARNQVNELAALVEEDRKAEIDRRHSTIRQFQMAQAQSDVDVFSSAPLFNDIELSAICGDGNEVKNAGEIIVDLAPLSSDQTLELRLHDLFEILRTNENFLNYGMVDAGTLNKRLREGIVYRICDFREYFIWRSILFNEIKDSEKVRQANQAMGVDLNLMTDHITHLIMASVFSTDTKIQNENHRKEGCA